MTEDTAETALWPLLLAALPHTGGLDSAPGECVHSLREADAATLRLGLPVRAVPLTPRAGFAAQCASHQADAELAYLRARSQSVDGTVWMQAEQQGDRYWALCSPEHGAWRVRQWVGVTSLQGHAAVPVCLVAPKLPPNEPIVAGHLARLLDAAALNSAQVVVQFVCLDGRTVLDFAWSEADEVSHLLRLESVLSTYGAGCLLFLEPEAGHVITVQGLEQAQAMPGVIEACVNAKPGDAIRHITSVAARDAVGWVLSAGATPEEAQARAEHAAAGIEIETTAFLQG